MNQIPLAERDDELRRLMVRLDDVEKERAAIHKRMKMLMGLQATKKAKPMFTQDHLDALAGIKSKRH